MLWGKESLWVSAHAWWEALGWLVLVLNSPTAPVSEPGGQLSPSGALPSLVPWGWGLWGCRLHLNPKRDMQGSPLPPAPKQLAAEGSGLGSGSQHPANGWAAAVWQLSAPGWDMTQTPAVAVVCVESC